MSEEDQKRKTCLEALFRPEGIAVIGASRDPSAIGHQIVLALKQSQYPRPVYPVNPKAREIAELLAYPCLKSISNRVDLAIISVPALFVSSVIDECIEKRVKAIIVISAGFAESGKEGVKLQNEILAKVRAQGICMVGPNCFGVMNTDRLFPMNASFSSHFPLRGNIALASQSGGLGLALLGFSKLFQLGLSYFVSLGNKADLSSNDLIEFWWQDPETKVILLYLESFGNPARFLSLARKITQTKPIVVLKSGRSTAGTRAATSHTAALAASDRVVDSFLYQAGVLRVETMEQMFHLSQALSSQPLPEGRKIAIVTNAGGPAILCADACEAFGLKISELSSSLKENLRKVLPKEVNIENPLDLVASAGPKDFERTIPILLAAQEVDALIVIYTVIGKSVSSAILDSIQVAIEKARIGGSKKTVFLCWITEEAVFSPLKVGEETIPVYRFPEDTARTMAYMVEQKERQRESKKYSLSSNVSQVFDTSFKGGKREKEIRNLFEASAKKESTWLGPKETFSCLTMAEFPVISSKMVRQEEEAMQAAEEMGFPVALKLASKLVSHKTEMGGVHLNILDASAVRKTFQVIQENMQRLHPKEKEILIQVQPMAKKGVEIFLGMNRDPIFGPVIAFGLGGIYVEILSDIKFRVAPVTEWDVKQMVREIKGSQLLFGYRGQPPCDVEAIERLLLQLAWFAEKNQEIQSLDFNPVMALPVGHGCLILDARIEVRK